MRRFLITAFILVTALVFVSCGEKEQPPEEIQIPKESLEQSGSLAQSQGSEATPEELYIEFMECYAKENYFGQTFYGVAFLDLDLNGTDELILYHMPVSATCPMEIYTIENGELCAFSQNAYQKELPKAKNYLDSFVCGAPYTQSEEFLEREGLCLFLYENKDGTKAFHITSGNGNEDFVEYEVLKFSRKDGGLFAESIFSYKQYGSGFSDEKLASKNFINDQEVSYEEFIREIENWNKDFREENKLINLEETAQNTTYYVDSLSKNLVL